VRLEDSAGSGSEGVAGCVWGDCFLEGRGGRFGGGGSGIIEDSSGELCEFIGSSGGEVNAMKASMEQSKAVLAQSEARLSKTKMDYDRNVKLHADKVISDSDFDQFSLAYMVAKQDLEAAKANVKAANFNVKSSEAGLKEARTNLTKTTIYAPQSGIIFEVEC
jgi:hypothetical protein